MTSDVRGPFGFGRDEVCHESQTRHATVQYKKQCTDVQKWECFPFSTIKLSGFCDIVRL